jgi:glucose-1-phosphate cytidylyltransferase
MEKLSQEGKMVAFEHQDFWQSMDTVRDKMYLEELWASGEAPWKVWN